MEPAVPGDPVVFEPSRVEAALGDVTPIAVEDCEILQKDDQEVPEVAEPELDRASDP